MQLPKSRFALLVCAISSLAVAAPVQVTLLHVNDTHSHLAAWGPKDAQLDGTLGGLEKAATLIAAEKTANPSALFVHGGDLFHGDYFFNEYLGVPELLLLQQLGLDVMAPGNHELQFGPDFLAGVLYATWPEGGGVSIVGTNLDLTAYPALGMWISPTVIKEVNGVKVGFFGLTTPYDPLEQPAPVVIGTDLAGISAATAQQLRAEGAQLVVCIAHLGMDLSRQLAGAVDGVDVIVNGHDHVALAQPETVVRPGGGSTLIVSAGEYYRYVGRLRLTVDGSQVSLVDYALLPADASTPRLPLIAPTIEGLKAGIVARYGDVYHDPIAWADVAIADDYDSKHKRRDTAIGDLFTDAYRAATGTEIAIEANGFLDEGLPAGTLVGADVLRSMGYGLPVFDPGAGRYIVRPFRLATFKISGANLLAGLEAGASTPGGVFPQVSGVTFDFDSTAPAGSKVSAGSVRVNGRKLVLSRLYTATGNEGLLMFLPMLGVEVQDPVVLPATADETARAYFEQLGVLVPEKQARITDVAKKK